MWQVAGCVLTLVLVAAIGGWWFSPWLVTPVMTVAFTAAWSAHAASHDATGLWAVGAFLVLVGMAIGSSVVSVAAWLLHRRTGSGSTGAGG